MIEKSMGKRSGIFMYYTFLKTYHRDPIDLTDYADGLKSLEVDIRIENKLRKDHG